MRIAIISDLHLGDDLCSLVHPGDDPTPVPGYAALLRALEAFAPLDELVLVGDVIDLSATTYPLAYRAAGAFFRQLAADGITREVIYVPGNHDFTMWEIVEHEVNVRQQIAHGRAPRPFHRSVPCVIDCRGRAPGRPDTSVYLHGVKHERMDDGHRGYGGLFLNHITGEGGPEINFLFAYPNLYLVLDDERSILVTHGHYFEPYWSAAGEPAVLLSKSGSLEVPWEDPADFPNLRELVGTNYPLNQLACAGVGQAPPLSDLLYRIKRGVERGRPVELEHVLRRVEEYLARQGVLGGFRQAAVGVAWGMLVRWLVRALESPDARYDDRFASRPAVQQRFHDYYAATLRELREINAGGWEPAPIPDPTAVIFGHTHQPIPWASRAALTEIGGTPIELCNTGGWLLHELPDGRLEIPGAEVFLVDTDRREVTSVSVRQEDLAPFEPAAPADRGCEDDPLELAS